MSTALVGQRESIYIAVSRDQCIVHDKGQNTLHLLIEVVGQDYNGDERDTHRKLEERGGRGRGRERERERERDRERAVE